MAIPCPHLFLYLFFDFSQVDKNNTKTSGDKIIRTKDFLLFNISRDIDYKVNEGNLNKRENKLLG